MTEIDKIKRSEKRKEAMPTTATKTLPKVLQPYFAHGLDLDWREGAEEATGDCPFCAREGKFSVSAKTGLWRCYVCNAGTQDGGGNATIFLRELWSVSEDGTKEYAELRDQRELLEEDTLIHWGVCRSAVTNQWLVPGFSVEAQLRQLYRYMKIKNRWKLLGTPTLGHQLHGVDLYHKDRPVVFLCEGPWDAMALWEVLGRCKEDNDEKLRPTANWKKSLLAEANILAVPGCTTFFEKWLPLFAGKTVNLMFDNDHPRKHPKTGKQLKPAGLDGMRKVTGMLSSAKEPPKAINYLRWGEKGWNPDLPSGHDVRDTLTYPDYREGSNGNGEGLAALPEAVSRGLAARVEACEGLLSKLYPVPEEWLNGRRRASKGSDGAVALEPAKCCEYRKLRMAWRKALKWTPGLDHALTIMLASVASTKSMGDQLWIKVIGPASCGKSTLCEALNVAQDYVISKDTFTGLSSGYQTDDAGSENLSLVTKIKDKTLIINDGDTLLQLPNLPAVISQLRAFYGRNLRTAYKNKMSMDHEGYNTTIILCGTSSLRKLDQSELGERFLDVVIMEKIDEELEDEILLRVAYRADRNVGQEMGDDLESQQEPAMIEAMALTGGYVEWLRKSAGQKIDRIENPDWAVRKCTRLAKFIACMRARPSMHQEETAEREFGSRLTSQLVRLAKCLALVLNRDSVDKTVMARVQQVTLDTGRGKTLALTAHLYDADEDGMEHKSLSLATSMSEQRTRSLLRFLRAIDVTEVFRKKGASKLQGTLRWRLTERMTRLYREVAEKT